MKKKSFIGYAGECWENGFVMSTDGYVICKTIIRKRKICLLNIKVRITIEEIK